MKKALIYGLMVILVVASCATMAETVDMNLTYCNPLTLPSMDVSTARTAMPESAEGIMDASRANALLDKERWTAADARSTIRAALGNLGRGVTDDDARMIADVFPYQVSDGTVYLYATGSMQNDAEYGACWSSKDYVNWEYHRMNRGVTAPTFVEINGKFYLAGNSTPVFVADSPIGPWTELGKFVLPNGTEAGFGDVNFFLDDDGRLYLTYSIGSPIMGCELNPENPCQMLTEPVELWQTNTVNEWERFGSSNQNSLCGYTEGSQIFKYNGTYYLQVATNGTENISYCIGVKKSNEGPLSGYEYQQNNPVTYDVDNFVPGVGHGGFLVNDNNDLILFYTSCISYEFGRRVGMDICYVDANGDVCLKEATDTPQLAPNRVEDPSLGSDIGLSTLSDIGSSYWATSYTSGNLPIYAVDNSAMTWWMPEADDEQPIFISGLKSIFDVYAVQINWKEMGTFTRDNAVQYIIKYFDLEKNDWAIFADCSENTTANTITYDTVKTPVRTVAMCVDMLGTTEDIALGIIDLRIFGENYNLALEKGRIAA